MEKNNRELLIKEISSRLPYGIKAQVLAWNEEKGETEVPLKVYSINTDGYVYFESNGYDIDYVDAEDCLLYLRPMSSMTKEEEYEFVLFSDTMFRYGKDNNLCCLPLDAIHWLLKNHFDFMGLIPKGLAIEVTKNNNPYESNM